MMKLYRMLFVALVLLMTCVLSPSAWADPPKLTGTPEYTEVTQAITTLLQAKESPDEAGLLPETIEQQLGELKLQKYILETARGWAQCRNETGKTLAVYAHKAKSTATPTLFYLGNNQETDDDWNCDGVYLPSGTPVSGLQIPSDQAEPLALKVTSGAKFVVKANPDGHLAFNLNPAKIFKSGENSWAIPTLTPETIATTAPNAPIED